MNLRQRYKRLKQENEWLKNRTVKPVLQVKHYNIETLGVNRIVDPFEWRVFSENIKREMIDHLIMYIVPYIDFEYLRNPNPEGMIEIHAKLKVVDDNSNREE